MCQPKSLGGRRCPSHSDPIRVAGRNAKRRELYKLKKAGLIQSVLNENTIFQKVPNSATPANFRNRFMDQTFHGNLMSDLFRSNNSTAELEKLNIKASANDGLLVDHNYFAPKSMSGIIDYQNLNEDSYKEFGFLKPETGDHHEKEVGFNESEMAELSKSELKGIGKRNVAALRFFTSDEFEWFNSAHYGNEYGLNKDTNDDHDSVLDKLTESTSSFTSLPYKYRSKKAVRELTEKLDETLKMGPKVPRILYRGVEDMSGNFRDMDPKEWIEDNATLGQEVVFDGYQSTSASYAKSKEYAGYGNGVVYEILTPEGINVTGISEYDTEFEIILPRKSRYMVVGVHLSETDDMHHHIQLVAINDKGEILDGTNADEKEPIYNDEFEGVNHVST